MSRFGMLGKKSKELAKHPVVAIKLSIITGSQVMPFVR